MSDPIGQTIGGKYRVIRRLGGGGIADIYEAVHAHIGQKFALKVLRPEFAKYVEMRERFLNEARAASMIGHPGVV